MSRDRVPERKERTVFYTFGVYNIKGEKFRSLNKEAKEEIFDVLSRIVPLAIKIKKGSLNIEFKRNNVTVEFVLSKNENRSDERLREIIETKVDKEMDRTEGNLFLISIKPKKKKTSTSKKTKKEKSVPPPRNDKKEPIQVIMVTFNGLEADYEPDVYFIPTDPNNTNKKLLRAIEKEKTGQKDELVIFFFGLIIEDFDSQDDFIETVYSKYRELDKLLKPYSSEEYIKREQPIILKKKYFFVQE